MRPHDTPFDTAWLAPNVFKRAQSHEGSASRASYDLFPWADAESLSLQWMHTTRAGAGRYAVTAAYAGRLAKLRESVQAHGVQLPEECDLFFSTPYFGNALQALPVSVGAQLSAADALVSASPFAGDGGSFLVPFYRDTKAPYAVWYIYFRESGSYCVVHSQLRPPFEGADGVPSPASVQYAAPSIPQFLLRMYIDFELYFQAKGQTLRLEAVHPDFRARIEAIAGLYVSRLYLHYAPRMEQHGTAHFESATFIANFSLSRHPDPLLSVQQWSIAELPHLFCGPLWTSDELVSRLDLGGIGLGALHLFLNETAYAVRMCARRGEDLALPQGWLENKRGALREYLHRNVRNYMNCLNEDRLLFQRIQLIGVRVARYWVLISDELSRLTHVLGGRYAKAHAAEARKAVDTLVMAGHIVSCVRTYQHELMSVNECMWDGVHEGRWMTVLHLEALRYHFRSLHYTTSRLHVGLMRFLVRSYHVYSLLYAPDARRLDCGDRRLAFAMCSKSPGSRWSALDRDLLDYILLLVTPLASLMLSPRGAM